MVAGAASTGSPTLTALSLVAAFISHSPVDYIGETRYKSIKESAIFEGAMLAAYGIASLISSVSVWVLIAAWISANLPDIIDNYRMLVLKKPKWFACHNGVGLFQYKGFKLGYPVRIKLSYKQTVVLNILATIAYCLYVILK